MIQKSIGLARNLIKKRDLIKDMVKRIALADDVLMITSTNHQIAISGQTSSNAVNVVLLGSAVAASHGIVQKQEPEYELNQYLEQISTVAYRRQELNK